MSVKSFREFFYAIIILMFALFVFNSIQFKRSTELTMAGACWLLKKADVMKKFHIGQFLNLVRKLHHLSRVFCRCEQLGWSTLAQKTSKFIVPLVL